MTWHSMRPSSTWAGSSLDSARPLLMLTVYGRAVLFLCLAVVFLRAEPVPSERRNG